jgi:Uma2 family endonuclease
MVARRRQDETAVNGAAVRPPRPVHYPESDGKPMAETPVHRDEMMRLIQTLQDAFADRDDVYVSGNMMMYYEEGNPRASVSPDVFVTLGIDKHADRRVYKTWEDGPPSIVIEVTSPSTRREDVSKKRDVYANMGVKEYILYDPLGEYLRPALQGLRLVDGEYRPMSAEPPGLVSEVLGAHLSLVDGRLVLTDRRTGAALLSPAEQLPREIATQAELRTRIAELEAELRRLRSGESE